MNVNSQQVGHTAVHQGRQNEPDAASDVGQFLKKSVKEIHLRNIFWDVDQYKYLSEDQKFYTGLRLSLLPRCTIAACSLALAKYMSFDKLGLASATLAGWLVGSQISHSIGKEFLKEYQRLQSEDIRNAVDTYQPQLDSIRGSNLSSADEESEDTQQSYEQCVSDNTVLQKVSHPDDLNDPTIVE